MAAVNALAANRGAGKRRGAAAQRGARRSPQAQPQASLGSRIGLWLGRMVVLLGVVVVGVAGVRGGEYLLAIPVEQIVVTGQVDNVSVVSIEDRVAAAVGPGFLLADLEAIRTDLEAMPWVYAASVRRRWPSTIDIHVVEQRPVARWGDDGFLNHEGQRFAGAHTGRWAQLPQLVGPEGSEAAMTRRYRFLGELLVTLDLEVVRLTQDALGQYSAELNNGWEVMFGADDFVARARRFARLYHRDLKGQAVARVDLRYRAGAAVRFDDRALALASEFTRGEQ